jgi:hypothetical protein
MIVPSFTGLLVQWYSLEMVGCFDCGGSLALFAA